MLTAACILALGGNRRVGAHLFAPQRESRGTDVIEKSRRFGVQHGERFFTNTNQNRSEAQHYGHA